MRRAGPSSIGGVPVLPRSFSPATLSRLSLAHAVAHGLIVVTGGAGRGGAAGAGGRGAAPRGGGAPPPPARR